MSDDRKKTRHVTGFLHELLNSSTITGTISVGIGGNHPAHQFEGTHKMFSAKKARGQAPGKIIVNAFCVGKCGEESVRMDALLLDTATGAWGPIELEPEEGRISSELVLERLRNVLCIPVSSVFLKVEETREEGSVLVYKYQLTPDDMDALRAHRRIRFAAKRPDPRFTWNPNDRTLELT